MNAKAPFRSYLEALRLGDRRGAFAVIDRALDDGLGVQQLYLSVLQPSLREIGRLWRESELSVAEEHLATAITQNVMAHLYERIFDGERSTGRSVLAACAASERHEIGLRMVCDLLELAGWDTTYLGSCPPTDDLIRLLERRRPQVLALSAALPAHSAEIGETIQAVRRRFAGDAPLIVVGGLAFMDDPTLATRLGAELTAEDAAEAVTTLSVDLS